MRPAVSSGKRGAAGPQRASAFEVDPHPREAEHLGRTPLDLLELVPNGSPLEEVGRDVGEERRLTPPLLGLDGAAA